MSWIKIEHGLCKSRKIAKLSSAMGWSRHQAIGFMVDFWIWAAQSCDDGQLRDITDSEIAFAGGLEQAKGILAALIASGFVDREPLRIHQWAEHQAHLIRYTPEYRKWRDNILKSNNYKCAKCLSTEDVEAHHIKPLAKFPELATDKDNGIALCALCHRKEHARKK